MADKFFLEIPSDALSNIRKKYNLGTKERLDEAINLFEDWIKKQEHFTRKDFNKRFLETLLISTKGSVERAKQRLEKLFTLRTELPEFFEVVNPRDLKYLDGLRCGVLPKLDKDYNRVFLLKGIANCFHPLMYTNFYKRNIIMAEYLRHNDYCDGFIIIFDDTSINVMDLLTGFNLLETRNILKLLMEGYGMRMKGMHVILPNTASATVCELLLKVFKTVLSEKLANRLYMHRSVDEIFDHVPQEMFPRDYGGKEMSLDELNEKWNDILGSEEHMKLMKEVNEARIDKTKLGDKHYDDFGLSGSFRKLVID